MNNQSYSAGAGPGQITVLHMPFPAITNRCHCPESEESTNAAWTVEGYQCPVSGQWKCPIIHRATHQPSLTSRPVVEALHTGGWAELGSWGKAPVSRDCQYCAGHCQKRGNSVVIQLWTNSLCLTQWKGVGAQGVLSRGKPGNDGASKAGRDRAVQREELQLCRGAGS